MNTKYSSVNILIVDDTSEHLYNAGNILQPLGYPIRVALTGHRALELIQEEKPTVIILDIMLEDMNGFQICNHLKSNPDYADISVIFVTGINDEETIQEGFRIGGQDYVTKPYRPLELIARVQNHIQLSIQNAELKYAYHELDHFCQNVSHDLKSPLLVIQQLAVMLIDATSKPINTNTQTISDMLSDKCQQTLAMVERLLELSHITQMPLHEKPVDIRQLFQNIASELVLLEPERTFDIYIDEAIPILSADEELLKIMIQNILSNAIKFTRHRAVSKIEISCAFQTTSIILSIRDNGIGFDSKYVDKLFQVFSRLHNTSEYEGTGVGLTIIARIMKIHGGTADITGEPENGAIISLHFPLSCVITTL